MAGAPPTPAPDSPRPSQSPAPLGPAGDIEQELLGLANALYNLGTTVINDSTKDVPKPVPGQPLPTDDQKESVKDIPVKINGIIEYLSRLNQLANSPELTGIKVPLQVLSDIDNSRNPLLLTKERLERVAAENQFMNGKMHAVERYNTLLEDALSETYPELSPYLPSSSNQRPPEATQDPESFKSEWSMDEDSPAMLNGISTSQSQASPLTQTQ
ncbi:transcription factor subunit Med10 of mediator complex-domain-containing protein [Flagelloscypha sp. PMI_526]|nr:transcription factor subunit Med10 of mediator complex-domain-containing protein [Flagelloscypha sp. PMI_526]